MKIHVIKEIKIFACRRCFNYIFILDLTPSFNKLRKDKCKMKWDTYTFWNLVRLILEIWRHIPWVQNSKSQCNVSVYIWSMATATGQRSFVHKSYVFSILQRSYPCPSIIRTVKYRPNAIDIITILHTALRKQWQKVNHGLESQYLKHPIPLSQGRAVERWFWGFLRKLTAL